MKPKEFILELFRETDFYETLDWRKLEKSEDGESLRSALGISKAGLQRLPEWAGRGRRRRSDLGERSSKRTSMRNWKFGGNSRHRRR